jgi:hypothetical protein
MQPRGTYFMADEKDPKKDPEEQDQERPEEVAKTGPNDPGPGLPHDSDEEETQAQDQPEEPEPEPISDEDADQAELEELRANEETFSWQASEYVHHHKGPIWYVILVVGIILLMGGAALAHYWLAIGAFFAMGAAIFVYAEKPPRTLAYELSRDGITIDGKAFPYELFRSYGVLKDIEWHTIDLTPVKRFSPRMSILFKVEDLDTITDHLDLHLPRTDRDPDIIENLSSYLRF